MQAQVAAAMTAISQGLLQRVQSAGVDKKKAITSVDKGAEAQEAEEPRRRATGAVCGVWCVVCGWTWLKGG